MAQYSTVPLADALAHLLEQGPPFAAPVALLCDGGADWITRERAFELVAEIADDAARGRAWRELYRGPVPGHVDVLVVVEGAVPFVAAIDLAEHPWWLSPEPTEGEADVEAEPEDEDPTATRTP